jgi:oxygen-independent coproporphyrinogen-3 oxidase
MKYKVTIADRRQLPNVEAALKIVDPRAELISEAEATALQVAIDYTVSTTGLAVKVTAPELGDFTWERQDQEIMDPRYGAADRAQRLKELVRLGVLKVVGGYLDKKPPWGILSGVRPTKIFHYLRDKGFAAAEIKTKLTSVYGLVPAKAELLVEVGAGQERFFKSREFVGIYIGIPFCPTRCHYCSFAAVSLETHKHLIPAFLTALEWEIRMIGAFCQEMGLIPESIYVGGGTPTSLATEDFCRVLEWTAQTFKSELTSEFTVEAGRPETITSAKIAAMLQTGVNRISVNPQTMSQCTLDRIGRAHTVDQVREAVALVRSGPLVLNMDLILGLPGEGSAEFADSLTQVLALQPDNLTIHTLAPKRASSWRKSFDALALAPDGELQEVNTRALQQLRQEGYFPYYLYRQRGILADLENIGYTRPGRASVYNVQMMEERQTIFGLGGGAVTKWVSGPAFRVERHQNPKCPSTYAQRIENEVAAKTRQARLLLC